MIEVRCSIAASIKPEDYPAYFAEKTTVSGEPVEPITEQKQLQERTSPRPAATTKQVKHVSQKKFKERKSIGSAGTRKSVKQVAIPRKVKKIKTHELTIPKKLVKQVARQKKVKERKIGMTNTMSNKRSANLNAKFNL